MNLTDNKQVEARKRDQEILDACSHQAMYDERKALLSLEDEDDPIRSRTNTEQDSGLLNAPGTPAFGMTPSRAVRVKSSDNGSNSEQGNGEIEDKARQIQMTTMAAKRSSRRSISFDEEIVVSGGNMLCMHCMHVHYSRCLQWKYLL